MLYVNYITIKTLGKAGKWSIQKSPECCSLGKKTRCKIVAVVQWLIRVSWPLFTTLYDPMDCSTSGFPVLHHLLEFAQTHVHWVNDATQPSNPLSPASPPALCLSQHQGLFQWVLYIRWPKNWSFSFSISLSKEYSGLISFRIDWFDLLAVQGTLKNLSNTTVWKHQFLGPQASLRSNSHIHAWLLEKP